MSSEPALDDIVTEFLLNTCLLRPRASKQALQSGLICGVVAAKQPEDIDSKCVPLTTGSVAEFYIEPMLPLVGDIDVMYHEHTQLAIPRGHPPPTQLPAEFHNYVKVYEIIDSHLIPGYLYLELRYLLTECSDDGKYRSVEYDRGQYLSNRGCGYTGTLLHGPAIFVPKLVTQQFELSIDVVHCIRCLSWPLQAADWPTRHRNSGENKVIRFAKCDAFSGVCESIPEFRAIGCESICGNFTTSGS